jgi:hypothetical protein
MAPAEPTMKNVAFTPFWARISRIAGVYLGSGPSSKVRLMILSVVPPQRVTVVELGKATISWSMIRLCAPST